MQQLKRIFRLVIAMQAIIFASNLQAAQISNNDGISAKHHYASFFLTTGSGNVDVSPGENLIFNSQVALSGIEYDTETGVFTLCPGTYAVTYFFAPFSMPAINMYVNGQLILNSPLGGNSTVFTVTEPTNTLTLQYITTGSFAAPGANQSWASISIFQVDKIH